MPKAAARSLSIAVGVDNSWLTVDNSSFIGNRSWQDGSAIHAGGGAVTVKNSSFVGNEAGGFFASAAIHMINPSALLTVDNSSFTNNSRSGISVANGAIARLTHVTIYGSDPAISTSESGFESHGKLYLRNSVLSGELRSAVCDHLRQNIGNLIAADSCSPRLSGDPMLEKPTDTSAYLANRCRAVRLINGADARFCPETDQLGRPRSLFG